MDNLNTQTRQVENIPIGKESVTLLMVDKKQIDSVLEKNIMSFGSRVIVAECYRHAIEAATNTKSDLITINMNLLGIDRSRLISKFKEVVGDSNFISSDMFEDEVDQKKKNQKILYYVVKPLEVNQIQSILAHISKKKMSRDYLPN